MKKRRRKRTENDQTATARSNARLFLHRARTEAHRAATLSEVRAMHDAAVRVALSAASAASVLSDELGRLDRMRRAKELRVRAKRVIKVLGREP